MNLHNLFENDNSTPNPNYAEELAYQIFKAAPNLDTTGAADEVLDYAFDLAVNDLGRKRAHSLFAYDEDFDSDLVSAYAHLQRQGAEKEQVSEADPHNFDSDEDYYAAQNAPVKRRSAPSDYPYSREEDDAYFNDIFRKKREAAKKAEQDKGSLTEFAEKPENGPGSDEYEDLLFHLAWEIWSEAGDSAQAERKLSLLGWKPEFGDDYTAMVLYKIGSNDHRQYTIDEFEEYGGSGDEQGVAEGRVSEIAAEYEDYKKLSPREFFNMYRITKQAWLAKYKSMLPQQPTVEGQEVDASVVIGKLYDIIDHAEDTIKNADYDRQVQYATTVRDRAVKALNMIKQGGNTPEAASAAFRYMQTGEQGVAEADKKKEDEPEVRDVALQRAISRAKADFPTAGTGIEALAKDFMRSQDQDSKSFDQLRQAERKQDQMLSQISKIDQEQEQEIQDLETQNSTLASRLQQLQNVNSELEKKLAAMSGRKAEKKSKTNTTVSTAAPAATTEPITPVGAPAKAKTGPKKIAPTTSKAIGQIAKTLSPPASSAAIDQIAQQLQPRQKELDFDNNPVTLKPSKFDTSKAVDASYRDVSTKLARAALSNPELNVSQRNNMDALRNLAAQQEMPVETKDKSTKSEHPEADYGDKYQDMVARVGQKAREQEKSKPVDIKDLARRLAAIESSRKDE